MPTTYNLRSLHKGEKSNSVRNCYLKNYLKNRSPEAFNPTVCLKRLNLECEDVQNSRFYLKRDGITIKQERPKTFNKKNCVKFICLILLLLLCLIYCRDKIQFYGITIGKKFSEYQPAVQNYYNEAAVGLKNAINSLSLLKYNFGSNKMKSDYKVLEQKIVLESKNDMEFMKLIRDNFIELSNKNKIENLNSTFTTFIEEQCKANNEDDLERFFDESNFTDYALEAKGAEIVTVFDTEAYGTKGVKFLSYYVWPPLGRFLISRSKYFFTNGPNSILTPWKKPGDCWAFKGSRGRVQIKLSEKIFISAITIDHIPITAQPDGNLKSAPKKFSIVGVEEPGTLIGGKYLGSYEYKSPGPSSQTFLVQPKVQVPFLWIDLSIESNHGNENYTCVYKVRVHGHK